MQTKNRILSDMARAATGAAGVLTGARSEVEAVLRQRLERLLAGTDMVSREEFEAVRAAAIKARETQEALEKRIAALERKGAGKATRTAGKRTTGKASARASRPATRKTTKQPAGKTAARRKPRRSKTS